MSNPELSTDMTLDAALGTLAETLKPIHKALSHVTREVRPADAAFTRLCKAVRLLQGEVERLRAENAALKENASATLYHESLRLKRENTELRERVAFLGEEPLPLSARELAELDWFRRREKYVEELRRRVGREVPDDHFLHVLSGWEAGNPKPGAGT